VVLDEFLEDVQIALEGYEKRKALAKRILLAQAAAEREGISTSEANA